MKAMTRRNLLLATLLVIQLCVVAFVFWPRETGAAAGPLVSELTLDNITGLTVQDADNQVQLARVDGQWVLPAVDGYPALAANVTKLISDVLTVDTSRLVANTPASHGRLKVSPNDYLRRVELVGADGQRIAFFIGASPNVGTTHVRRDGQDAVYLTPAALSTDARTDLAGWFDTAYLRTSPDTLKRITVQNSQGGYTLSQAESGEWTLAGLAPGATVKADQVALLASRLATVSLTKPLGKSLNPEYGLDQPQATITLTVAPAGGLTETVTLAVGASDDKAGTYVVKASTSDYYGLVSKFQLQEFVEQGRVELVEAQAPPALDVTAPPSGTAPVRSTAGVAMPEQVEAASPAVVASGTTEPTLAPTSPLTVTGQVTP